MEITFAMINPVLILKIMVECGFRFRRGGIRIRGGIFIRTRDDPANFTRRAPHTNRVYVLIMHFSAGYARARARSG